MGRPKGKRLYEVTLDDGTVATSLRKYEVGELAQAWLDPRYDKIKLVKP